MSSTALNPAALINTANTGATYSTAYPNSSPYLTIAANLQPGVCGTADGLAAYTTSTPNLATANIQTTTAFATAPKTAVNPATPFNNFQTYNPAGTGTLGTINGPTEYPNIGVQGVGTTL